MLKAVNTVVPVHLISGFLGSGKTTFLSRLIDYYQLQNVKAAVIMNELGDVNLDGQILGDQVPMTEMLSGCICCTIRGDLGMEIKGIIDEHQPDVLLIESTGAANPLEIIDGITEAAYLTPIDLQSITTLVDGAGLIAMSKRGGKTFKLMREQVTYASHLVINKADRVTPEELVMVQQLTAEWNAHAPATVTVKGITELERFAVSAAEASGISLIELNRKEETAAVCGPNCGHDHHDHDHDHEHEHKHDTQAESAVGATHASHEHVMVLTHYLTEPVDGEAFEALLRSLPDEVYRAKGIVTFKETNSRFLFQYAYKETDFIRITPQGEVQDVAVFIGEFFSKPALLAALSGLQKA